MNLFKIVMHAICIAGLFVLLIIQYKIMQSNRGQAMGIDIAVYLIPPAILITLILFFIDRTHTNHYSRIIAIITQVLFLPYFLYKIVFYYRAYHDIEFYKERFDDHYAPHIETVWFTFFVICLLLFYSVKKIRAQKIASKNVSTIETK